MSTRQGTPNGAWQVVYGRETRENMKHARKWSKIAMSKLLYRRTQREHCPELGLDEVDALLLASWRFVERARPQQQCRRVHPERRRVEPHARAGCIRTGVRPAPFGTGDGPVEFGLVDDDPLGVLELEVLLDYVVLDQQRRGILLASGVRAKGGRPRDEGLEGRDQQCVEAHVNRKTRRLRVPPVDHHAVALRVEPAMAVVAGGREVVVDQAGGAREKRAHGGGVPRGPEVP